MVREHSIESFYGKLRESALASAYSPLLIFPSTSDVDSLCALKIIGRVLELDSVRYACYPVSSFKEIHKYAGRSLSSSCDTPITILLINWGCHRDLKKILEIGPAARVFVVDSHRPIHLHNLSDQNDRVVVLYTGDDENQSDLTYDFDVSALAAASDLNSEDEIEEDDENESDGDDDGNRKGAIRSGSKFRWVKLEDSKLLGHPQALTKFGYFLMDALREKGAKMKPLICVCYTQGKDKVLIVGVCGKPRLGAVQGNAFGIAFRSAAEETGAEFFHELFESSFMISLTQKLL